MPGMTLLPGCRQLWAVDNLRQSLTTVRATKDFAALGMLVGRAARQRSLHAIKSTASGAREHWVPGRALDQGQWSDPG
jgi:hypothetical protein